MYEISRESEEREAEEARKRMLSGKASEAEAEGEPCTEKVQGRKRALQSKDRAASDVGTSRDTLRKIGVVMEAAQADPNGYEDIVERMDETGNVSEAFRELNNRKRRQNIKEQSRRVRAEKKKSHDHRIYMADHFGMVEDGCVDLVATDPPYNISRPRHIVFSEERAPMSNDFGDWDCTEEEEFIEGLQKWSDEFYRVLRDGGSLYTFAAEPYAFAFRAALIRAGFRFKNTLVWFRPNPKPPPEKTSYIAACDFMLFAVKGTGHTFEYAGNNERLSMIRMPACSGNERSKWGHPTQKPVKLIQGLIEVSSKPGDIVLDPFAGSGTTGEACQNTGRRFILIERDPEYIQMIEARTGVRHERMT